MGAHRPSVQRQIRCANPSSLASIIETEQGAFRQLRSERGNGIVLAYMTFRQAQALYIYLWATPHLLQIVLAVLMVRRKLVREFPVFFAYTIFEILQFVILFPLMFLHLMGLYAPVFYVTEIISAGLRFAMIYEIFGNVFRNYSSLERLRGSFFRWATVLLMITAVLIVAYTPTTQTDRTVIIMNVVDRTVSIMQCGLLLVLVALSYFFKFSWRSYAFGIALGLAIYDGLKLLDWAIGDRFGSIATNAFFTMFLMAAYHCCVLFWLVTLLLLQSQRASAPVVSPSTIEQWNNSLERFLQW